MIEHRARDFRNGKSFFHIQRLVITQMSSYFKIIRCYADLNSKLPSANKGGDLEFSCFIFCLADIQAGAASGSVCVEGGGGGMKN